MFEELGYWEVMAEAEGVEPVRALCAQVQPSEAVRLVLTAVGVQRPRVSAGAWRFRCRRLDVPGSEPLVYRVQRRRGGPSSELEAPAPAATRGAA